MKIRTIGLISTLVLGLLAGPLPTEAQQAGKVYRIGYLRFSCSSLTTNAPYIAFRQGLRELGYVEGQNYIIEYRCADRKREQRAEMAAELVRLKVDVIVIPGAPGLLLAAQRATRTIPIVMSGMRVDPVKAGFVVSLRRPGGNITRLTNLSAKLHPKSLELLKEASPRISRVAIIWPRGRARRTMKEIEPVAQALGIQILSAVYRGNDSGALESALSAISRGRSDALLCTTTGFTLDHRARIIDFAAKNHMPSMYNRRRFVTDGGLMFYGTDTPDLYRRVAVYVDRILKGAKPADLPVEQPRKFEFIINLKTAKQIGLIIPQSVLYRADKIIK